MLLLASLATTATGQEFMAPAKPPDTPKVTFHSSSNLVLVPVIAQNAKGSTAGTLTRDDFQVLDNGQPVSIATFESGTQTRPLALWFVVQCSMSNFDSEGSGFFRGHIHLLEPALKTLEAQDKIGVAHWCDNGDSKVDLPPTSSVDEAVTALEQVLAVTVHADDHDRPGELALERTLQSVVDATSPLIPEHVPVVIFLYGDHSGMPRSEADHFIDELLGTSATVYGLKDRRSPGILFLPGEQKEVAHYIANQTGGEYLQVTPQNYAAGLEEILRQLHSRYELGFKPAALDGKRHKLHVQLAGHARHERKQVRLRYRTAYLAAGAGIS